MKRAVCFFSLLLIFILSCGDEKGDGNGDKNGMEKKKIGQLSEAELKELCLSNASKVQKIFTKDAMCTFVGVMMAMREADEENFPQVCEEGKKQCMEDLQFSPPSPEKMCPDEKIKQSKENLSDPECKEVTVEEYNACTDGLVSNLKETFASVSCQKKPEASPTFEPELPEECKKIEEKCRPEAIKPKHPSPEI
jgi:hypothetical protein